METKNLILAIVASVAILLGFELFYNQPRMEQQAQVADQQQPGEDALRPQARDDGSLPGAAPDTDPQGEASAPGAAVPGGVRDRDQVLGEDPRVRIDTPSLTGSISLTGGRVDDLTLLNYRETVDDDSPNVVLLSPPGTARGYYADFGWSAVGDDVALPDRETVWEADAEVLAPGQDVTLSWDNGEGLVFERVFSLDEDYMFTVTQRVINETDSEVALAPYSLISRHYTPQTLGYFILHEGPIAVLDNSLTEPSYGDLRDDGVIEGESTGGWIGLTDKYWLVSVIPEPDERVNTRFVYSDAGGGDRYQADFLAGTRSIGAGQSVENTSRLFAGAKEVTLLDRYQETYNIDRFDRAVDFGWFYFLTKPVFLILHFFAGIFGNFGVAILLLVVLIKIVFFPLANKSYKSMAKMRKVQPEMMRIRERYKDDRQRMNQEMMTLYKKEQVNPLSGCLPILIQIPVFFALYKVLFVTIEMRHAPFFGWIQDLSAQDPTSLLNLFGLLPYQVPNLGPFEFVNLGIWPILMGITMWAQFKLNPQPADPMQAKIFAIMPIIFTFLLAQFPAGLVIYWTWNNLLSIAQQYVMIRRYGKPEPMQFGLSPKAKKANGNGAGGDSEEAEKTPSPKANGEDQPSPTPAQAEGESGAAASQGQGTAKNAPGKPATRRRNTAAKPKGRGGSRKR